MRLSILALTAVAATASATASLSLRDTEALLRRQAPGTPQYDCHANCGGVITIARTENYCDNSTFTTELEACLECALEFNIWQYYGESVGAAAERCGLDATPVAAANATSTNGTASTTSSSAPTGSTTSGSGSGAASTSASATAASSGSAGAASGTASTTAATSTFTGAASHFVVSGALALVPFGAFFLGCL
ncbi:hypothetical protein LTR84_000528 [Exophiala bonariae]|uniref:Uncharacterized protein n=1 Tax=Exophiala bonariae TaxID=1690606 RepID=A0AAV9NQS0_9EURO|nr:hypothetical protein LTR84_000528 [Exophiala bonariae]